MCAAVLTDLRTRRIPNRLVLSMAGGGAVTALLKTFFDTHGALSPGPLLDSISGLLSALAVFALLSLVFPGAMGGGDVKLLAASGLYLGLAGTLRAMAFTFLSGGLFTLLLLALGIIETRGKTPYAPYIALGVFMALWVQARGLW
ncbi:MAG TPA: prepilin peptidase [Firmicutes bacterium]|nr:prepilin peptidase [Candidatus Fermentithermobacillaceae bacterium]